MQKTKSKTPTPRNFFRNEGYNLFPDRTEQQNIYIKTESEFMKILRNYMNRRQPNDEIKSALTLLLKEISFLNNPYVFDEDILEEIVKLESITEEMINVIEVRPD